MQKSGPLKTVILPIFLVLLLLGLSARFWVSDLEYSFTGPSHITAGTTGVYLYASGSIFHLSSEGEFLAVIDISRTGLEEGPWVTGREHNTVNELTIGERYYPMMLEFADDGRLWVIQAT